jgi:hypothetical protein
MDDDLKKRVRKMDKWLDDKSKLSLEKTKLDGILI